MVAMWNMSCVGNSVEPTPHGLKKCQHCHVILLHQKIDRTRMYDHEDGKKVFFFRKNTNWTRQSLLVVFLLFFYFALHKNLAVTHAPIPSNWSNLIFLSQSLRPTSDPGVSLQDGCWSSIMLFSVLQTFTCCDLPWTKRNSADLTSSFGWCHRSPQESWPCWGPCCYGHN